ncbi:MAG: 6-bladed beta-propeller [Gemmatimonadetes bacterium]|nr:6-bladed beta-propeller [Gemmatimonadota bacterium]
MMAVRFMLASSMLGVAVAALFTTLGLGCERAISSSTASDFDVADSAGVAIISNRGTGTEHAREGAGLRLDLRVGVTEGEEAYQFHRVVEIVPDPATGDIIVADAGSSVVRVFDASGRWLRTLGRRGTGPGEFTRPGALMVLGDSIFAVNGANYQAAVFDRSGALVRAFPITVPDCVVYPVGRTESGWFAWLWSSNLPGGPPATGQIRQDSIEVRHLTEITTAPGDNLSLLREAPLVARFARGARSVVIPVGDRLTTSPVLWDPEPAYGADRTGHFYVSAGSPYRIDAWDGSGRLVRSVRRDVPVVPVTDEMRSEYEQRVLTHYDTIGPGPGRDVDRRRMLASLDGPRNDVVPPLGRLLVSHDGAFWVERPDLAADLVGPANFSTTVVQPTTWDRFDTDGRFVGAVLLPAAFTPRAVEGNSVYGVLRDEFDVEHVARYEIER